MQPKHLQAISMAVPCQSKNNRVGQSCLMDRR